MIDRSYIVTFRGLDEKRAGDLLKMLCEDIAAYPDRMSMSSASVHPVDPTSPKPKRAKDAKS
jgi:hypothetical protein